MPESDTTIVERAGLTSEGASPARDSQIGGLSVRSLITLMITATLCFYVVAYVVTQIMRGMTIETIGEPFYGLSYVVIGYYFGSAKQPKT